jgi:putative nucleotidyltransferase with HDIG domain
MEQCVPDQISVSTDNVNPLDLINGGQQEAHISSDGAPDIVASSQNTQDKSWFAQRIQATKHAVGEWKRMRREIAHYPQQTKARMKEIEKQFTLYRLSLTNLTYKAPKIEDEIFEIYNQVEKKIPELEQQNHKQLLFFFTNPKLRQIEKDWQSVEASQDHLSGLLNKAPKGMEFYNRMQIVREQKRQDEIRQKENESRIEIAYESLKKALAYVEHECKNDEPILFGNEILTISDAQKIWTTNMDEILNLREAKSTSVDHLLDEIHSLEDVIRDYPTISKQVQRVGERFSRLIAFHDLLSSYGKRIIPQAEITRASSIMYEQIPALWSSGDYVNLKVYLERVENFLNFYENSVELEVAIGERRRSGFTQNLTSMILPGSNGISPIINVARVLVAAIDQRDRYMVGHSDRVARLALQTGRKLNWTSSDLEFLEVAALLHDIGKISIPENILTKVKPLTNQEYKMIQMHPYYGAQIVKQMNVFNRIVPWIYHHQEHWDGSGYPDKLSKDDIPDASAIISIAEAYTVMTADLPYRKTSTVDQAIEAIEKDAGTQFSPGIVEAFVEGAKEMAVKESAEGNKQ